MSLKSELQEILKINYDSKEQGFDGEEAYDIYFSHEEAVQATLDLLDKSLPKNRFAQLWDTINAASYNAALDDVREAFGLPQASVRLVGEDALERAIVRCGRGFRSLSFHSDGRWIAKSGANTGKFLATARTPLEAVLKLEAKLDVRKVIKEG